MAEEKKSWDLKSAKDVAEALEWIRRRMKGSGLVVLAVGVNSIAYSKDPSLSPEDAVQVIQEQLVNARCGLEAIHANKETRGHSRRRMD